MTDLLPSLKLTRRPLKGWFPIGLSFSRGPYFQGLLLLVSGRKNEQWKKTRIPIGFRTYKVDVQSFLFKKESSKIWLILVTRTWHTNQSTVNPTPKVDPRCKMTIWRETHTLLPRNSNDCWDNVVLRIRLDEVSLGFLIRRWLCVTSWVSCSLSGEITTEVSREIQALK